METSQNLSADYSAPNSAKKFEISLPNPAVAHTTDYLSSLKTSTSQLQRQINSFLTEAMEQDRARSAPTGQATRTNIDDKQEEENYGEEAD